MITSELLCEKCEQLNPRERETVGQFIDFLLSKHATVQRHGQQALLHTSVWSDEDIRLIEQVQQEMAQWQIPTFS